MPAFRPLARAGFPVDSVVIGSVMASVREARPSIQCIVLLRLLCGAALMAPQSWWQSPALAVTLLAWLATSHAAYLLNGITDLVEDRANGSRRPIAAGALPLAQARRVLCGLVAVALVLAALAGPTMVALVLGGLALAWTYSVPARAGSYRAAWSTGLVIAFCWLTYTAGLLAVPAEERGDLGTLLAFAGGLTAWLLVGGIAKDLSDLKGDQLAGRRSWPVVLGVEHCRIALAGLAVTVGVAFHLVCASVAPRLSEVAALVLGGGILVSITATCALSPDLQRLPYHVFMVTQYAAHIAVLLLVVG